MPKVFCRDPANEQAFLALEEQCHVTYTLAARQQAVSSERDDATRAAVQWAATVRPGKELDPLAGLDLADRDDQG